ncbi:hypothetical protein OHA61_01020 [Streptomyces sp. NBC_00885]|nr:hypothetical protein OHA61_01020 [Streptomyces sp. NBC_00885]
MAPTEAAISTGGPASTALARRHPDQPRQAQLPAAGPVSSVTANSSAPSLPTGARLPTQAVSRFAVAAGTASPTACRRLSLISSKWFPGLPLAAASSDLVFLPTFD